MRYLLISLLSMILFAGCDMFPRNKPEDVVREYVSAVLSMNIDKELSLMISDSKERYRESYVETHSKYMPEGSKELKQVLLEKFDVNSYSELKSMPIDDFIKLYYRNSPILHSLGGVSITQAAELRSVKLDSVIVENSILSIIRGIRLAIIKSNVEFKTFESLNSINISFILKIEDSKWKIQSSIPVD